MKFWQKKKSFEVSETDQIYKVIYLGNVVTSWAKGEQTLLEKPLTALWRNYCNNYANYHIKNDNKRGKSVQNKQILMKLTLCNQGLKAITREYGLTQYWSNRITFCGQNSNFPRVFAWIYRHEAKQKKQELRVHACFVSSQSNVNKMISTLQQKVSFALNEFKREKRLRENARKILSMNESMNLDDDDEMAASQDKTDSEFFNAFVGRIYSKMNGEANDVKKLIKDDQSITSSERMTNCESVNTSKNSTLDKKIIRNPSQGSLNSLKSKSSTSSRKSNNYDNNLIPVRKQFLVKGLKNFKEPIERSRSAPKLSSIIEEFSSDDEEEEEEDEHYFDKLVLLNNNFVNYYNICEEEPDDEEIIRELGLISGLAMPENDHDKTLTEFNDENDLKLTSIFNETYNNDLRNLSTTSYEENEDLNIFEKSINHLDNLVENHLRENNLLEKTLTDNDEHSSDDEQVKLNGHLLNEIKSSLCNGNSKDKLINDCLNESEINQINKELTNNSSQINQLKEQHSLDEQSIENSCSESNDVESSTSSSNDNQFTNRIESNHVDDDKTIRINTTIDISNQQTKDSYLYSTCQSPQFIIVGDKMRSQCDLHTKQIIENCKLIEDLVLNF